MNQFGDTVWNDIKRPSKELLDHLAKFSVPALCDSCEISHAMDYQIKPWLGRTKIVGPAVTVDVPLGESRLVSEAVKNASPGDIIVIAGKGSCATAYWGDRRSFEAFENGVIGAIIDGAFRDLEGCEEYPVQIFAKGLTCTGSGKSGEGSVNVPVICGGVCVNPGDIIAADVNGVCVITQEEAEQVLARAEEKRETEVRCDIS